jgi:integrase
MRPRFQAGQIFHKGPNWVLRYWEDRAGANGTVKRVRTVVPLAPYGQYPYRGTATDLERLREIFKDKIASLLSPVNSESPIAKSTLTLGEFISNSYFPRLNWRLAQPSGNELHIEPSTIEGYQYIWNIRVKDSAAAKIPLRSFSPRDAQQYLESLPAELSHQRHLRIKNFLRGVFTWAISDGSYVGNNPFENAKAGGRKVAGELSGLSEGEKIRRAKTLKSNKHAYSLLEVAEMLDKLPEPARTVCAVAAFTGFTRSELMGLKWSDYDGKEISIQRKIWSGKEGAPKTEAREAGVFVVPLLRSILAKYKKDYPAGKDDWIFRGEKLLRPINLDNLSRRDIPQHINGAWFGWHAFRRGLGSRLNEAGVDGKEIQSILRHADVSTTMAFYVLPDQKRAQKGLKKLEQVARKKYNIKA